jgi:hypothetical protein
MYMHVCMFGLCVNPQPLLLNLEDPSGNMDASSRIEALAKASGSLGRDEVRRMHCACEIGKATLESAAAQLIAWAEGSPVGL